MLYSCTHGNSARQRVKLSISGWYACGQSVYNSDAQSILSRQANLGYTISRLSRCSVSAKCRRSVSQCSSSRLSVWLPPRTDFDVSTDVIPTKLSRTILQRCILGTRTRTRSTRTGTRTRRVLVYCGTSHIWSSAKSLPCIGLHSLPVSILSTFWPVAPTTPMLLSQAPLLSVVYQLCSANIRH